MATPAAAATPAPTPAPVPPPIDFEPEAVAAAALGLQRAADGSYPQLSVGGRRLLAEVDRLIAQMERSGGGAAGGLAPAAAVKHLEKLIGELSAPPEGESTC